MAKKRISSLRRRARNYRASTKGANKNVSLIVNAVLILVGVWVVYTIFRSLKGFGKNIQAKADQAALSAQGVKPTYMDYQYDSFASKLNQADGYINDDEDAIYSVAKKMKNDADLIKLSAALTSGEYGSDLAVYLADVFDQSEINKWNKITAANGCTISY